MGFTNKVIFRLLVAMAIGVLIGSERARHGRAAGIRTHILVCISSALTALIGIYSKDYLGNDDGIFRISAQVISGIGFLGAGMIILKNNATIMGLTTAAGVWATSIIGIAVGCGFYAGAITSTAIFLISVVLLSKLEKQKRANQIIYIEIDDMYRANQIIDAARVKIGNDFSYKMTSPKSLRDGNLGISITVLRKYGANITKFLEIEGVVYAEEE